MEKNQECRMKAIDLSCKWNLGKNRAYVVQLSTQLPKPHIISLKDLIDPEGGICLY